MSEVAELTAALVRIDSVNPALIAGAAGEREVAGFVAEWLAEAGLEVEVVEPVPGRPSVIATARGTGGGRALLLNAHLDTVGTEAMDAPFHAHVEGRPALRARLLRHEGRARGGDARRSRCGERTASPAM